MIAATKHPVILVGHSCGGVVITVAGSDWKVTHDHMIPLTLQRFMAKCAKAIVVEQNSSHAVMISHPEAAATLDSTRSGFGTRPLRSLILTRQIGMMVAIGDQAATFRGHG